MTKRVGLGDMVASMPYAVGYDLTEQHVAIAILDQTQHVVCGAAIEYAASSEFVSAAAILAQTYATIGQSHGAQGAIVFAYGPDGPERLEEIRAAIQQQAAGDPSLTLIHVNENLWSATLPDGEALGPQPVPASSEAVPPGTPAPAARREDIAALYEPLSVPTFEELSAIDKAILDRSRPALRAEIATRTLHNLTQNPTAKARATLAHLTSDVIIRDAVIAVASNDTAQRKALIDTYRQAPEAVRGKLAAAAGAAMYLAGDQSPRVEAVLNHAEPGNNLVRLMRQSVEMGVDPRLIREGLSDASTTGVREADAQWVTQTPTRHHERRERSTGPSV